MGIIKNQKNIKEEIAQQYLYALNKEKHEEIIKQFKHISKSSIYNSHLKIACQEHCKFLNALPQETKDKIAPAKDTSKVFVLRVGDEFRPNLKFINSCIEQAIKKGQYLSFDFFQANVVLDRLRENLENRGKKLKIKL